MTHLHTLISARCLVVAHPISIKLCILLNLKYSSSTSSESCDLRTLDLPVNPSSSGAYSSSQSSHHSNKPNQPQRIPCASSQRSPHRSTIIANLLPLLPVLLLTPLQLKRSPSSSSQTVRACHPPSSTPTTRGSHIPNQPGWLGRDRARVRDMLNCNSSLRRRRKARVLTPPSLPPLPIVRTRMLSRLCRSREYPKTSIPRQSQDWTRLYLSLKRRDT
ncbi:MAG: hypothetical protein J3R72DRAFT_432446 [Linnemannia gamsii]|nr:MAG: hypothetical protein J3R72DRAFT_432446 [Linnemannia gamsii]